MIFIIKTRKRFQTTILKQFLSFLLHFYAPFHFLSQSSSTPCSSFFLHFFLSLLFSLSFLHRISSSIPVYSSLVPTVSSTSLPRLRYFIIGTIRPLSWIIPQADKVAEYRRVSLYGSSVSPSVPFFHPSPSSLHIEELQAFFLLLLGVFRERESSFSSLVIVPGSIIMPGSGWERGDYLIKVDTKLQILCIDEYSHKIRDIVIMLRVNEYSRNNWCLKHV